MKRKARVLSVLFLGILLYAAAAGKKSGFPEEENSREEVTITWFVAEEGYSKVWDPQNHTGDAKILRNTGVNLELTSGDLTDLDALIATDALPDLITVEAGAAERFLIEDSGMAAPLEPLFETYAKDANIPESMKEWYRNKDGNWYSIASYYYGPERVNSEYGGYLGTHNSNYVRSDLLEEIGVPVKSLETKEGALEALRAAKKLTWQGQEIIPFSGWWTRNFAEQFGMQVEDENGNYLSKYRQPEWLEALQFGNQLYREGLMLPEEFTESLNQRRKQVQAGRVFFCTGYSNVQEAKDLLQSANPDAQMMYAGHIRGAEGKKPNLKSVPSGGWTVTMVRADAEPMDRIISFIAYMVSEEATLDAAPAIGAGTWELIDQRCVRKESVRREFEENYEKASEKYFMNLEFFVDWTIIQRYQTRQERQNAKKEYIGCEIYDSKAADAAAAVSADSGMLEIKEKVENFYRNAEIEILTCGSQEECASKYQEALKEMERLGLKELEAYESTQYQKAKEKIEGIRKNTVPE